MAADLYRLRDDDDLAAEESLEQLLAQDLALAPLFNSIVDDDGDENNAPLSLEDNLILPSLPLKASMQKWRANCSKQRASRSDGRKQLAPLSPLTNGQPLRVREASFERIESVERTKTAADEEHAAMLAVPRDAYEGSSRSPPPPSPVQPPAWQRASLRTAFARWRDHLGVQHVRAAMRTCSAAAVQTQRLSAAFAAIKQSARVAATCSELAFLSIALAATLR